MDVSPVRPRSLARMTHLARRVAAACHQDRVDGLAAASRSWPWPAALVGLARAWGRWLNGVLHRDREPGTGVAPSG